MRNPEIVLKNLFKQSQENKDYIFEKLYKNLYNKEFYIKAFTQLYSSHGSSTPGTDGQTLDGFSDEVIEKLIEQLKNEQYEAKPAKRIYIRKKNGTKRPIGIPSKDDKIIQKIMEMILTAIYEPTFSNSSFGFRQNRGCHDAIMNILKNFKGVNWFIEGDITSFFDNIDHHILIDILRRKIKDEKFIRLIWKFLKAGYLEQWEFNKTYSGTPQGGIISPILANIYLNELDDYMLQLIEKYNVGTESSQKITQEYNRVTTQLTAVRKKIKNAKFINNTNEFKELKCIENELINKKIKTTRYDYNSKINFKKLLYVRYADDFLIGVIGSQEDSMQIKDEIAKFLCEELKLELSQEKTLITHSSDTAKFLGYEISTYKTAIIKRWKDKTKPFVKNGENKFARNYIKQRAGIYGVKLTMPKTVVTKKLKELNVVRDLNEQPWRATKRGILLNNSDLEIVQTYNQQIVGLYNYYKLANNVSAEMNKFYQVMKWSLVHTLAGKHKCHLTEVLKKYHYHGLGEDKGDTIRVQYQNKKGENRICKFYHEGFKRNQKVDLRLRPTIDNINTIWKFMGRTELEVRIKAGKCEVCGYEGKCEVHHINKLSNIKDGKTWWERLMIERNRKTLIVCKDCHNKIHNGTI